MGCCKYVLLSLVNKESPLTYGRAEYSKAGTPCRDRGEKKMEPERHHVAAEGERPRTSYTQPCGDTEINRNGLI